MGPLPSAADFAAAAVAAAAEAGEGAAEASDSSAATVEVQLAGEADWQGLPIEPKTIGVRLPEGYQLPPAPAAAATEGVNIQQEAQMPDGDVQMGDGQQLQQQQQHTAAGGNRKRHREQVEQVCKKVEEDMQGAVRMWVLAGSAGGSADAVPVCLECTAKPAPTAASGEDVSAGATGPGDTDGSSSSSPWKRLKLLMPECYPQQPPVLVFQPGKALAGPEEQQQQQDMHRLSARSSADLGASACRQQQQLAEEAWAELQAALWEEPVIDLKGVAKHWCQAVGAVLVQHGFLP
ncbi:hypothetical protein COO60DRAFT_559713 [Scenedesmus sp. NREL 46B-D3]|nr:hypothetical protein COO60DRAFT_559713 [Scenedesmus sp. NREL 46B-D3]